MGSDIYGILKIIAKKELRGLEESEEAEVLKSLEELLKLQQLKRREVTIRGRFFSISQSFKQILNQVYSLISCEWNSVNPYDSLAERICQMSFEDTWPH